MYIYILPPSKNNLKQLTIKMPKYNQALKQSLSLKMIQIMKQSKRRWLITPFSIEHKIVSVLPQSQTRE